MMRIRLCALDTMSLAYESIRRYRIAGSPEKASVQLTGEPESNLFASMFDGRFEPEMMASK